MKVIVAGCGRVGAQMAEMLSMDGHDVVVVDNDRESFRRLSKLYGGALVEGMAFDEETLIHAGIKDADAFAAVTNYDNTNLMAAEVAIEIFGVPRVVSRLYNPDKEQTFEALNVDYVCGTTCMAEDIMERLIAPKLIVRSKFALNAYLLVEFTAPPKWNGQSLAQLEKREGLRIAWVARGDKAAIPDQDGVIAAGDVLVASIRQNRARRLERMLRK